MYSSCDSLHNFPFAALPKGLRSLDVSTKRKIEDLDFLNHLFRFPLLTKLRLVSDNEEYSSHNLNKTICLPNLTELHTHQWILNSATFVLPELRKIIIEHIYDSSLNYLKEFKKLKKIQLDDAKEGIKELIDPNLIFSFSNLNEFRYKTIHQDKFISDIASNQISKSLVYVEVNNGDSIKHYCKNANAKTLQKKKITFLCKYGSYI